MRRLNPTAIALIAGTFLVLILVIVFARGGGSGQDRLSDNQLTEARSERPEQRCASQDTYDLIKRELFRRAAQLRGSDLAAFGRLSAYASARMVDPVLRSEDEDLGTISCEGALTLDLPPGVAVVGGRRSLSADIGYSLQTAADGSGDVVTLTNAEGIITPLATLARTGSTPLRAPSAPADPLAPLSDTSEPAAPAPSEPRPVPNDPPPAAAPPPPQPNPPQVSANPSFNCRNARTRGEIAVCGNPGLAGLDRQMASQFNSAMSRADSGQRALLQRTRSRFLSYRDRCRSESCMADAYRGRMTEISDIMAGRWSPR